VSGFRELTTKQMNLVSGPAVHALMTDYQRRSCWDLSVGGQLSPWARRPAGRLRRSAEPDLGRPASRSAPNPPFRAEARVIASLVLLFIASAPSGSTTWCNMRSESRPECRARLAPRHAPAGTEHRYPRHEGCRDRHSVVFGRDLGWSETTSTHSLCGYSFVGSSDSGDRVAMLWPSTAPRV